MNVSGEMASAYDAISLSDFETVNKGKLVSADDETGAVSWQDKTGKTKSVTLGQRAIRILPRKR
jgi:hypothetical protein